MGPETEPDPVAPGGLLLTGARLADGRAVDVRLSGERIEAVGTPGSLRATDRVERVDLAGYLLLPAPAEPHAHLDAALTAFWGLTGLTAQPSGPAAPADGEDLRRRITEAALTHLGYGSTAVRTHVLVSDATGLTRLDAAQQAARDLRGLMDLQITAVPGPLTGVTGQEGRALLREAARMGVHALGGSVWDGGMWDGGMWDGSARGGSARGGGARGGGAGGGRVPGRRADIDAGPELEPGGPLAALLELAHSCGLPLDLHVNPRPSGHAEPAAPRSSPASAHSSAASPHSADSRDEDRLSALLDRLPAGSLLTVTGPLRPSAVAALAAAAARVGVVVLPQGGCGAGASGPEGFDAATVRRLADAGVPLAAGSGALRDATRPVGRADPIEAAFLLAAQAGLSAAAAYDAVGPGARARLGLPASAVEAGRPAELLALRGESLAAALSGGHSRVVLHAGRVVSRTSAVREYADTTTAAVPRQVRPPRRA